MSLYSLTVTHLLFLTAVLPVPTTVTRKGCINAFPGNGQQHGSTRSNVANTDKVHLSADIRDLEKGIKRDVVSGNNDCGETKYNEVIHQAAASAIPSKREAVTKTNVIGKNVNSVVAERSPTRETISKIDTNLRKTLSAMSPIFNTMSENAQKRLIINELSKKVVDKNSISSLIAAVKARENLTSKPTPASSVHDEPKIGTRKGTLDKVLENNKTKIIFNKVPESSSKTLLGTIDDKESLRAALAKAIDKVERVVQNKNIGGIMKTFQKPENSVNATVAEKSPATQGKPNAEKLVNSQPKSSEEKPPDSQTKPIEQKTANVQAKSNEEKTPNPPAKPNEDKTPKEKVINTQTKPNSTNITSVAKPVKPVRDPYAEIAMGPDKPKIPELKSEDPGAGVQHVTSDLKESKPLGGVHDVGGLLDRLTDKLNMGGGGVAGETNPMDSNDVKYMQSQLGVDDTMGKQDDQMKNNPGYDSIKGMQGDMPMKSDDSAKSMENDIPLKGIPIDEPPKAMSTMKDEVDPSELHKGFDEKQENSDGSDGLVKDILDKASTLSKGNQIEGGKGGGVERGGGDDYTGGADITPGPYPDEGEQRSNSDSFGSMEGSNKNFDMSDMLNGGTISNGQSNSYNHGNQDDGYGDTYDRSDMGTGSHNMNSNEEQTPSRSRGRNAESYINEGLNGGGTDSEFSTRQNIPETLWSATRTSQPSLDTYTSDSFNDNYNTQLFKKNIILRPQRDYYVSPFDGKDSFEIEM